ncbi:tyrosine-type recombinase/integrase [Sphingobium sp. HWE2-09]|uniref:tyrosine-type recombinase/integrase n=1 Tax=Sphingobium sp. HWE2-09 TaxID=3108390 RepID=UPI002DC24899|nr:site-specific integrase [Sphingobium sp. HWE2-09]
MAKSGLDPVAERDRERRSSPTFSEAAKATHLALKSGWKEKGAQVFIKSLENHAYPAFGGKRVDDISAGDITAALAPIWTSKPDMARKVKQRIRNVLDFAHSKGWRPTEAPGRSVAVALPRQPKGGHHSAMPYVEAPAFVAKLQADAPTIGRQALLFQIFTAARQGEVRAARWEQINLAKREWNRPADIMKTHQSHIVTLNEAAVWLLKSMNGNHVPNPKDLIFAGKGGTMLSDMTASKVLRTAGVPYNAHGFRSSFRDWAAEKMPNFPDDVAEAALAHVVADRVVRAYKRTTFLEMRRELLEAWSHFLQPSVAIPSAVTA